jgi:TolB protein
VKTVNEYTKASRFAFSLCLAILFALSGCTQSEPGRQSDSAVENAQGFSPISPLLAPEHSAFDSPLTSSLPDGILAFHSGDSGSLQIHRIDLQTGQEIRLIGMTPSFEPSWSPDCQQMVFAAKQDNSEDFGLYLMDQEGHNRRPLFSEEDLTPGLMKWAPAWSPTGEIIAYQANPDGLFQICFTSPEGDSLGCYSPGWSVVSPSWSPDGRQLVFSGLGDGSWDIYIADLIHSGGAISLENVVNLTKSSSVDAYPRMSQNGQYIAFQSDRQGTNDIYIMRTDGSELQAVVNDIADEVIPGWLRSEGIFYSQELVSGWEINLVDIRTGVVNKIKSSDSLNKWPVWCDAK